jgi:methylmalonyl-CoA mutase
VRARQVEKLERLRAARDARLVSEKLDALTEAATTDADLLALAIEAARARASVGEITFALEKVFGRHRAETDVISGVYALETGRSSREFARVASLVSAFVENDRRRPKILVAKVGQDGHDRGQKVVASALGDLGFEVVLGPLFASPEEVAAQAIEADVHIVGVSSLAAGHLTALPRLHAALAARGRPDIMIVVGGVVPPQDFAALAAAGVAAIFPPGSPIPEAAARMLDELNARLGYRQREVADVHELGAGCGRKTGCQFSSSRPGDARRSHICQTALISPPSIRTAVPVIHRAEGDTRNAIKAATSSGVP